MRVKAPLDTTLSLSAKASCKRVLLLITVALSIMRSCSRNSPLTIIRSASVTLLFSTSVKKPRRPKFTPIRGTPQNGRCSRNSPLTIMRSASVTLLSSTSVKKPRCPRFTPIRGTPQNGHRRATDKSVPSPPSTTMAEHASAISCSTHPSSRRSMREAKLIGSITSCLSAVSSAIICRVTATVLSFSRLAIIPRVIGSTSTRRRCHFASL